jgi:hypothetical protein
MFRIAQIFGIPKRMVKFVRERNQPVGRKHGDRSALVHNILKREAVGF